MLCDQVKQLLFRLLEALGGETAEQAALALAEDSLSSGCVDRPRPEDYTDAEVFWRDWQAYSLVAKLQEQDESRARALRLSAVESWLSSERSCALTNVRMRRWKYHLDNEFVGDLPVETFDLIARWRHEVKAAMGPLPSVLRPRFSGGATLSESALRATIPDKLSSKRASLYFETADIMNACLSGTSLVGRFAWPDECVDFNRFSTVPKDWKKDRAICVEPLWSLAFQLDIGRILKKRISRYIGYDFKNLDKRHSELARIASITGDWATLDLSSASDTISKELVRLILPEDWYMLLSSLRAVKTAFGDKKVYLSKFSSMGNGFTFELESLLFCTLARAVGDSSATSFGDDIIVKTEYADRVSSALEYFGFTVNVDKSFSSGPFRESCGGCFFKGQDVSAFNVKKIPSHPFDWVVLANKIYRYGTKHGLLRPLSKTGTPRGAWYRAWAYCIQQVPSNWRVFGPVCDDDRWILHPWPAVWAARYSSAHQCVHNRAYIPVNHRLSVSQHFSGEIVLGALLCGCRSVVSRRSPNRVTLTLDDVKGYTTKWIPIRASRAIVDSLQIIQSLRERKAVKPDVGSPYTGKYTRLGLPAEPITGADMAFVRAPWCPFPRRAHVPGMAEAVQPPRPKRYVTALPWQSYVFSV